MEQKKTGARGFLSGFSWLTRGLVGALLALVGAVTLGHGLFFPGQYYVENYYALVLVMLGLAALFALYLWWGKLRLAWEGSPLARWAPSPWVGLAVLLAAALALRLLVVLQYQMFPEVDYYTLYHAGAALAEQYDISGLPELLPRYMALFPHIFGYASFLSLLFSLFGTAPLVATAANAVLSTIALALVYYIGYRLQGHTLGFLAGLLWCFYPSQIFANLLVTSDPYYTTLLLGAIALLLALRERFPTRPWWQLALGGGGAGLLLSLANSARPVAIIIIIAVAVVVFVIRPPSPGGSLGRQALTAACLLAVYLAGNQLNAWVFTQRVGEPPASLPGFNLLVGFNPETNGSYSGADSDLLMEWNGREGLTAQQVQEAMLDAAWDRITSGEVDIPRLFYQKLLTLWQEDDAPVGYADGVLPHQHLWVAASNGYYYLLWLLALGAMAVLLRRRANAFLYLFPLYLIGLTMAHLLAEVAQRYHYSGNFCLALLAAYGIYQVGKSSWQKARENNPPREDVL